ncbi:MAG: hypothetical protein KME57_20120 [Scytonema hyalinum WJT4-NPBG1]|nr:hypothetical protein [Scytonema hyalinum WJT4-NPBG1]
MKESTYGRAMLNFSPDSRADIVNGLRDSQAPNQNVIPVSNPRLQVGGFRRLSPKP